MIDPIVIPELLRLIQEWMDTADVNETALIKASIMQKIGDTAPKHYQGPSGLTCADFIRDSIGSDGMVNFWRGNALKYIYRAGKKGGSPENFNIDILKAIDCLQRLLQEKAE